MPTEVEVVHHPLVSEVSESRESVQMNYTMDGLQEIQQISYEDKSAIGANRAYFTVKPPLGSLIDRSLLVELTVTVSTTGTVAANTGFGNYFAPKCMPANRAIDNCQLSVNSQSIMSEPARIVEVMSRNKMNQESIKRFRSLSPSEPDSFNRYENYALGPSYAGITAGGGAAVPASVAANSLNVDAYHSPFKLAPFGCGLDDFESRASFPYTETTVVNGLNQTVTRTYTFTEVLMNPFCMLRNGKAAAHVTSLDINLVFGDLRRIFSQIRSVSYQSASPGALVYSGVGLGDTPAPAQGGNGITVSIARARLLLKVATPSVAISPKHDISLNHFRLNTQPITETYDATGSVQVSFNPVRLSVIPSHVFIYAKPLLSAQRSYTADAFLAIQNISLTISNRTGLLSNMSQQELYLMSVENGVNMSYPQWTQRVGSILCLGFGRDLTGLLPGVREYIDFSFRITMQNTTYFDQTFKTTGALPAYLTADQSLPFELNVLFVTPQTLELQDQIGQLEMGISPDDISDAIQYGPSDMTVEDINQIVGSGGFGDWIKKGVHKGVKFVKKFARPVANVLGEVSKVPGLGAMAMPFHEAADQLASAVGTGGMKHRLEYVRGKGRMV